MNKTRETEKWLRRGRRSLFGVVVTFMVMSVFFLAACDNNAMDTDLTEVIAVEGLSKAAISVDTQRGEERGIRHHRNGERSFSREEYIRWAEERGYSREDLAQRNIWREYRLAQGATFRPAERHHQRFDKENKSETHFERRSRVRKG